MEDHKPILTKILGRTLWAGFQPIYDGHNGEPIWVCAVMILAYQRKQIYMGGFGVEIFCPDQAFFVNHSQEQIEKFLESREEHFEKEKRKD